MDKSAQNGRSMVEMLGVLAIVGVLSVGGIAGYTKAMAKHRVNQTLDQLALFTTNIRIMYGAKNASEAMNVENIIKFNLASPEMIREDRKSLRNPYNGDILVEATANKEGFVITYGGIDQAGCIAIATADWAGTASSGLVEMKIGSGGGRNFPEISFLNNNVYNWKNKNIPISVEDAGKACSSIENAISWEYNWMAY